MIQEGLQDTVDDDLNRVRDDLNQVRSLNNTRHMNGSSLQRGSAGA